MAFASKISLYTNYKVSKFHTNHCYEANLKDAYQALKRKDAEELIADLLEDFPPENLAEAAQGVISAGNPALIKEIDWSQGCPYKDVITQRPAEELL